MLKHWAHAQDQESHAGADAQELSHPGAAERNFLNLMKSIYKELTANIILNEKKQNKTMLSPPKIRIRQGSVLSKLLFNIVLEVTAIRN